MTVAIHPPQQHGERTRIVPQLMTGTGNDSQIGTTVSISNRSCIERWNEIIFRAVKNE